MAGASGSGKQIISAKEMIEKCIKPAVTFAKDQEDFQVMARTDAIAIYGFEEAMRRGRCMWRPGRICFLLRRLSLKI